MNTDEQYHQQLLTFLLAAEGLKSTLRHNWTQSGRREDSAEHSWRTALFFIVVQELWHLEVDAYKVLSMVVIHDLPEVEHGDIPGFMKDIAADEHMHHKLREQAAAKKLYGLLPEPLATKLTELQQEFEAGLTLEARIARALEKIETQLQHLQSGPEYWSDEERRNDHLLRYPDEAVQMLNNKHIAAIWAIIREQLHALLHPDDIAGPS